MSKLWIEIGDGFRQRDYETYLEYLEIQGLKLERRPGFAENYSEGLRGALEKRLGSIQEQLPTSGISPQFRCVIIEDTMPCAGPLF